jgi:hypothetical protein
MQLYMGEVGMEFGGPYLGELREANDILHDRDALQTRIAEDGYLLIRGLHDRDEIIEGRRVLVHRLAEEGQLVEGSDPMEALIRPDAPGAFGGGDKDLTHAPAMRQVLEGDRVMSFFSHFLGGPALTYDYKWIRAVANPHYTGAHYDVVYMGRGTRNLYTCWTPFSDIGLEDGPLAVCVGSHNFEKVKQTYGEMDVDRDHVHGWFSNDPVEIVDTFGGKWCTAEFRMGDALIFGMYTMHASINNMSKCCRLSSDTRYQLASEPVDERWVGENPIAHYGWDEKEKNITMEEARAYWGI